MLPAAMVQSQEAKPVEKKIYRWVDKDGKVQISDQLPPDAVDKARKEYNANTGSLKNSMQNQLNPTELAQAQQHAELEAQALAGAEKLKRIDQGMLANYETEQDLQRSFDERTDLLKQTVVSLNASIQSRRASLISTLNELADLELGGKKIPDTKIKLLEDNHAQMMKQAAQLDRLNTSYVSLQSEFAITLGKYRQMKLDSSDSQSSSTALAPAILQNQGKP